MKGTEIAPVQNNATTNSVTLSFQNLNYSVCIKDGQGELVNKGILNNISGLCKPG